MMEWVWEREKNRRVVNRNNLFLDIFDQDSIIFGKIRVCNLNIFMKNKPKTTNCQQFTEIYKQKYQ